MKYLVRKDRQKRNLYRSSENRFGALKALGGNRLALRTNFFVTRKGFFLHRAGISRVTVKNRCVLSGNPKSAYRDFRLSRSMFRRSASYGHISGVTKASW